MTVAAMAPPWSTIGAGVLAAVAVGLGVGNALRARGNLALSGDQRAIAAFMRRSADQGRPDGPPLPVNGARRATGGASGGAQGEVLLVDTLGELLAFYAAADVAFVAGSLAPIGGHNLLEPLSVGVPALTGPHVFNAEDIAQLVCFLALPQSGQMTGEFVRMDAGMHLIQ